MIYIYTAIYVLNKEGQIVEQVVLEIQTKAFFLCSMQTTERNLHWLTTRSGTFRRKRETAFDFKCVHVCHKKHLKLSINCRIKYQTNKAQPQQCKLQLHHRLTVTRLAHIKRSFSTTVNDVSFDLADHAKGILGGNFSQQPLNTQMLLISTSILKVLSSYSHKYLFAGKKKQKKTTYIREKN